MGPRAGGRVRLRHWPLAARGHDAGIPAIPMPVQLPGLHVEAESPSINPPAKAIMEITMVEGLGLGLREWRNKWNRNWTGNGKLGLHRHYMRHCEWWTWGPLGSLFYVGSTDCSWYGI